jgi:hypothetical protein
MNSIEKILQRTLTTEEESFILTEYRNYRKFQNQDILLEPLKYYRNTKKKAFAHIEKIKSNLASKEVSISF